MPESTEFRCACGRPPDHAEYSPEEDVRHFYCCECWVRAGNPPADWHARCVATYAALQAEKREADRA